MLFRSIVVVAAPNPIVGYVQSVTLVNPGTGYTVGDALSAVIPGGTGFYVPVSAIVPTPGLGGAPRWARPPLRSFQIQYSFMYPVADTTDTPPIDNVAP